MALYTIEDGVKGSPSRKRYGFAGFAVGLAIAGYIGYSVLSKSSSPINQSASAQSAQTVAAPKSLPTPLAWPGYGQSAYGVAGQGVLAVSSDTAQKVPIASLAKIITAMAVLKQKPLKPDEQGPTITITQQDIDSYEDYVRKDGAVVAVEVGEQITEYQALQAMLMPSANNMADTLARWAFGSVDNYTAYANTMLKELAVSQTNVADASGFSPSTVGTAHDLVQLGLLYMQNPVLSGISQQPQATIPFAGVVRNYNSLENKDGIVGIKVGNTDEAGRCFVVASVRNGKPVAVASVLGATNLSTAMADAVRLLNAGNTGYDAISR